MIKRIGYAKLGRSMQFDPARQGFQGNAATGNLVRRLALRNPDVEWVLVGKNDGVTGDFPSNVTNPWVSADDKVRNESFDVVPLIEQLDGIVVHLGQHGTSHDTIPQVPFSWAEALKDDKAMTHPFEWARNYGAYLVKGMNLYGDRTDGQGPVVYLCEDPRNFHKARDVKWPTGTDDILAQYQFEKTQLHERFQDARRPAELGFKAETSRGGELWTATHRYTFGGLELMILPDDWATWGQKSFEDRVPAGIATTSVSKYAGPGERRSWLTNEYLLKNFPDAPVYGKWDDGSLADVPAGTVIQNDPRDFADILGSFRVTLSLVAVTHSSKTGASWTVAKPFQCFAANTVCFQVGRIDDMGWILPSRRATPGTKQVGIVHGTRLYSIRDDWTREDLDLARWTRVEKPEEFRLASAAVVASKDLWTTLTGHQRALLGRRWDEALVESLIEKRLGL